MKKSLREKCPCSEFFKSIFSRIRTELAKFTERVTAIKVAVVGKKIIMVA